MVVHASMEGAMFNLRGFGKRECTDVFLFEGQRTEMSRNSEAYTVDVRSRACPRCQRTVKLRR